MLSLLILAQNSRGEHEVPDPSSGIPIIAIVLAAIVVAAIVLWFVLVKTTRRSRGMQPRADEPTIEPRA